MQFDALREAHPRPQFTREQWIDLNGPWSFAYDDADAGLAQTWMHKPEVFDRTIIVPFPPESRASGIADPAPHPVVWYRRVAQIAPQHRDKRLLLHFGAVDYRALVWVNGQLVAQHEGGHTPFSADITKALRHDGGEQIIVVRAEDLPRDLAQPRGKQEWRNRPHSIWYHRTTGIWQPVWLEPVADVHISELRWTPEADRGLLRLHVKLNRQPDHPLQVRVRLWLRDRLMTDDTYMIQTAELQREIFIEATDLNRPLQLLWSPKYPNLIEAALTLYDGETAIDDVQSYAGLRSASYASGRFLLNGLPYYLRLVLEQGYWPESHLAAPSAAALRREAELVKELGFNGVRIHQKVEDPRFLYWCDRIGLLVWGEMANAYVFTNTAIERLTREWLEVLNRDYNHPCIVTWVPINESWGVPSLARDTAQQSFVRALYYLTHALDHTRPVIGNDGWEHVASDVWGIHDYALDGATLRERYGTPEALEQTIRTVQPHYRSILISGQVWRGEPVILTECGGISYAPQAGQPWHGYGTVTTAEEYLEKYNELMLAVLDSPTIAGFCYTQLTDTEQESNGLLDANRTPKLATEALRAINMRYSKAVPGDQLTNAQLATGSVDTIS
ncbi:MAG: glycoside hydrolase family 2 [Chloroflexi bacterium]|nr:glycoside hydrolase family 2 [Chloroflexota bacterium]